MKKNFTKMFTMNKDELLSALPELLPDSYIVTRYKEEPDGIILLANSDTIIDMIDDTVPEDAEFEIWVPVKELFILILQKIII